MSAFIHHDSVVTADITIVNLPNLYLEVDDDEEEVGEVDEKSEEGGEDRESK